MADYYTHFCVCIEDITEDERAWMLERLQYLSDIEGLSIEELDKLTKDGYRGEEDFVSAVDFDYKFRDTGKSWELWFTHDESGDPDHVATFMVEFLKKWRPDSSLGFQWAGTCSKPRPDAYGGGAVFATARGYTWINTGTWLHRKEVAFEKRQKAKKKKTMKTRARK